VRSILDCDQSITPRLLYFPIFLQNCSQFLESGSDNLFQRMINSFELFEDGLLDLVQPEVDPFDPPTQKPYRRNKHEVYRMILEPWTLRTNHLL